MVVMKLIWQNSVSEANLRGRFTVQMDREFCFHINRIYENITY